MHAVNPQTSALDPSTVCGESLTASRSELVKGIHLLEPELTFLGRLGIQQRVLPAYRAEFFSLLGRACRGGLSVIAGQPQAHEQIIPAEQIEGAHFFPMRNRHLFRISSPLYRCWQPGIIAWLEDWDPAALIVEANPRYPSTPGAVRWMHARGRPVLGWGLGAPELVGRFAKIRLNARRSFLHTLDGVIAYSRRGAQEYMALGLPEDRVYVAANVAVPRPSHPLPGRPPDFEGRPKVLFVGRLQERKRVDLLLKACASLPLDLQPQVWIVGDGPARLEYQALADRIYPHAEFTGSLFGIELEKWFLQADLFVLPGTGGLAIQQAMSYGLPIIAAQGDGTQEDLVRPGNGWNIPPDDQPALLSTLTEALTDPARLRLMGAESYRIVAEQANLECMAASFIAALNSLPHFKAIGGL